MKTNISKVIIAALSLLVLASAAYGDAPLKSSLGLSMEQARLVAIIQKEKRDAIRPVRSELSRQERAQRRAKFAYDEAGMLALEEVIKPLRAKMREIMENEQAQIRELLTPEQNEKYTEVLKIQREMVGGSRDVKTAYKDVE